MRKVKVYVWHGMDWYYYGGNYIAVATTVHEARRAIKKAWEDEGSLGEWAERAADIARKPKVYAAPVAFLEGHGD